MNPKLENVKPEFKDENSLFLTFYMTDELTTQQSSKLAERLSLSSLLEEYMGSTGCMIYPMQPQAGSSIRCEATKLGKN